MVSNTSTLGLPSFSPPMATKSGQTLFAAPAAEIVFAVLPNGHAVPPLERLLLVQVEGESFSPGRCSPGRRPARKGLTGRTGRIAATARHCPQPVSRSSCAFCDCGHWLPGQSGYPLTISLARKTRSACLSISLATCSLQLGGLRRALPVNVAVVLLGVIHALHKFLDDAGRLERVGQDVGYAAGVPRNPDAFIDEYIMRVVEGCGGSTPFQVHTRAGLLRPAGVGALGVGGARWCSRRFPGGYVSGSPVPPTRRRSSCATPWAGKSPSP